LWKRGPFMSNEIYTLVEPDTPSAGIVVNSPHSGRNYSEGFVASSQLTLHQLRSSEDAFVDHLFDRAPALGLPMLSANFPRSFVDLNRSSEELDPALIIGLPQQNLNPRIASGLGVIPRVVAEGREIRRGKMSMLAARARLSKYYWPYHQKLTHLLDQTMERFGSVLLLDCHSMPSMSGGKDMIGYDIVLGDRFGASCNGAIMDIVESSFAEAGFRVGRNAPFAGAHLAQSYGNPTRGRHVIQIEVNRALYLNEEAITLSADFPMVKQRLTAVMTDIVDYLRPEMKMAAE